MQTGQTEHSQVYIGKRMYISDGYEVAERYKTGAEEDEKPAITIRSAGLYNQSGYFFIMAMEKQIKSHISKKINVLNPYFADELSKTMGHSLDESVNLLIQICAPLTHCSLSI